MELFFEDQLLSTATGFVMEFARAYGLVTNLHVVTGRSPVDGKCISHTGGIPNRAHFHVALSCAADKETGKGELIHFLPLDIKLHDDESGEKPVWVDDKTSENQNDYCIIPLKRFIPELHDAAYRLRAIEGGKVTLKRGVEKSNPVRYEDVNHFYPQVGHQVFVVGYPAGIGPSGVFPIWKGATVASEPLVGMTLAGRHVDDVFFVDGLTRSGMSGAPVVCLQKPGDTYFTDDGVVVEAAEAKPLLVGVYAGREGVTGSEADLALGRVWKVGAIERLFHRVAITDGDHHPP
jgi:hypothetical protein